VRTEIGVLSRTHDISAERVANSQGLGARTEHVVASRRSDYLPHPDSACAFESGHCHLNSASEHDTEA